MKSNAPKNPNDANLTIRDHQDPDKHWIGETLPAPTQGDIPGTVGTVSGPGDSPFPARADHLHKIDPTLLPSQVTWNPSITNVTLGTGAVITATRVDVPVYGTALRIIYLGCHIQFGTGSAITGDAQIALPVACPVRFVGKGIFSPIGRRVTVTWNTINVNSTGAIVRPDSTFPVDTNANRPVDISGTSLAGFLPAYTMDATSWLQVWGWYIA
jgi:hypothetical protein